MTSFLEKNEWVLPLGLFLIFLALTLPGISWGAPSAWHPDEIVVRSINALNSDYKFSETNFDYPDLPQYTMFFLGKLILALGYGEREILVASRVLSAVLAGLTVVITYIIARLIGAGTKTAGLSGLFLMSVSEMPHNGRFAHNDTYLIFFITLSVLSLLSYYKNRNRLWLYVSFLTIGMAASSKYIGGSLVLAPLLVYFIEQRGNIKKQWLSIGETLFISAALTILGFALGTPKALTWMAYYFKRLYTTLQWQVSYGYQPGSTRGILGQYSVMADGLGIALILLFGIAFLWMAWRVFRAFYGNTLAQEPQTKSIGIILLVILAIDLPMMISYNYQLRYFLALMPFLSILTALFIEQVYQQAEATNKKVYPFAISITVSAIVLYSLARIIGLMLLVMNDARIPASAFMDTLPEGRTLEHTYYPPTYDGERFEREHNYPIYFVKGTEPLPTDKRFEYNAGEAGLNERETDYFVVDDFTSRKFENQYYCDAMPLECMFFKQLETGQSEHYRLLAEFKYDLPPYLPQLSFEFINPAIRIYERIP